MGLRATDTPYARYCRVRAGTIPSRNRLSAEHPRYRSRRCCEEHLAAVYRALAANGRRRRSLKIGLSAGLSRSLSSSGLRNDGQRVARADRVRRGQVTELAIPGAARYQASEEKGRGRLIRARFYLAGIEYHAAVRRSAVRLFQGCGQQACRQPGVLGNVIEVAGSCGWLHARARVMCVCV